MKNVCEGCEHSKVKYKGADIFCTKYGIPIHSPRIYCVSNDPDRKKVQWVGINKADTEVIIYDRYSDNL